MIRAIIEVWVLIGLISLIYLQNNCDDVCYFKGKYRPTTLLLISIIFAPIIFLTTIFMYLWIRKSFVIPKNTVRRGK